MTPTDVLFVVVVIGFMTLGGPVIVLSLSKLPALDRFVRRHIQAFYLIQTALWVSFAAVAWIGRPRTWGLMTGLGLAGAACSIAMYVRHRRGKGQSRRLIS